jgi:type II secretory ATPase GspE/PulE/Tfp pilus assembly ATPase PilB-like protein
MEFSAYDIFTDSTPNADKTESGLVATNDHLAYLQDLARKLPLPHSRNLEALVLQQDDHGHTIVAMTQPNNVARKSQLAHYVRSPLGRLTAIEITSDQYNELRVAIYGDSGRRTADLAKDQHSTWGEHLANIGADTNHDLSGVSAPREQVRPVDSPDLTEVRHMNDIARKILHDAYKQNAADIYLESAVDKGRIRFRKDGMVRPYIKDIPHEQLGQIINIFANMASIPSHQLHLKPHDAIIPLPLRTLSGEVVMTDYRCEFLPAKHGIDLTIRVNVDVIRDITRIGFEPEQLGHIYRAIRARKGLVLVTGTTSSGKSNTREAILTILEADGTRKIYETGDPPEFDAPERTQIPITATCTWDKAFTASLRSSPDIIAPSEFRTAQESKFIINAALTGHLLVTTYHAGDIPTTFTRLLEFGIEPHFLADALRLIIAQDLVRVLCPRCKLPDEKARAAGIQHAFRERESHESDRPCTYCDNSGFRGLTAIAEVLPISPHLQSIIVNLGREASIPGIPGTHKITGRHIMEAAREEARKTGTVCLTIEEAAHRKVANGTTSLKEIDRVLMLNLDAVPSLVHSLPRFGVTSWSDLSARNGDRAVEDLHVEIPDLTGTHQHEYQRTLAPGAARAAGQ